MKKLILFFKILILLIILLIPASLALIEAPLGVCIAISAAGATFYVGCVIYNVIYRTKHTNKLMSTSAEYLHDYMEKQKDEIRANTHLARKKVVRSIRLGMAYGVLLILASLLITWGVGMIVNHYLLFDPDLIDDMWGRLIILAVLSIAFYVMFGLVPTNTILFAKFSNSHSLPHGITDIASDKDYPMLYAVAERAAQAVGYSGKYYLRRDLDDCGISVNEEYGAVFVYLPPSSLSVLTENELYTVLLHEFSHATNSDTRWSNRFANAVAKFNCDGRGFLNKFKSLLFEKVSDVVDEATDIYRTYSSLAQEQRADEAVKKYGDAQAYINCTAKDLMLSRYLSGPHPELYYNIYESETPITDYYERKVKLFEEALPTEYVRLKDVVLRTLPGKSDSHPTLSMRMKSLGVTDFDISERPQGKYLEEISEYIAKCSKIHALDKESWEEDRKTDYLEIKERLEKFEAKLSTGQSPDRYELWQSLTDYSMAAPQKAIALADKILASDPEDKQALAVKGMILCAMDRHEGLALLRKAVDKASFYSSAYLYSKYGDTVLRYGDEKLLEDARAEQSKVAQMALDSAAARYSLKKPSPQQILPCDLPKEQIADMCCVLNNHGEDLDSVYIAAQSNTKIKTHIVLYKLKNLNSRDIDNAFFEFLHMLESMDSFFIFFNGKGKLADAIRKQGIKLK